MLTPEQIEGLRDRAETLTEPLTEYLLQEIARRVAEAGQLTSTAAYQTWAAQKLGVSQQEMKRKVAELLGVAEEKAEELFVQSAEVGYRFDLERLPTGNAVPFAENNALQQIVQAAVEQTRGTLQNLTGTLGMTDPYGHLLPLADAYQKCSDFAFLQVFTGATDSNTAVRNAVRNLAEKGIQTIDYESGVHTSVEVAVRRNVMSSLGKMQEQISRQNHDSFGANGWEISAHGACAPDHEPIQGRQYSDAEYERLNGSLIRRIGTLNCGHAAFPIILGVNAPQYSEQELEQLRQENAKGVEYGGKQYTTYEATQHQRKIERAMRKQKKRILVDEATGDTEKLQIDQIRLQRLKQEYNRFSKATDLRTQPERAQVAGFGVKQAGAAKAAANQYYKHWSKFVGVNESAKTLANYCEMRYNRPDEYALLKQYVKGVNSGWISPLSGFENYKALHQRITSEIVGKTAADGTVIAGQVPHFLQRVIGTMVDPEKLKRDLRIIRRSGVEFEDIVQTIFFPQETRPIKTDRNGKRSRKFLGAKCAVTINPDTGMLIQTNPLGGDKNV